MENKSVVLDFGFMPFTLFREGFRKTTERDVEYYWSK